MNKTYKTNNIIKKIINIPMIIIEKIADIFVSFFIFLSRFNLKIRSIIGNSKIKNFYKYLNNYIVFRVIFFLIKILFLYVLTSLIFFCIFLIYISLVIYSIKDLLPFLTRYNYASFLDEYILNIESYINIYILILSILIIVFSFFVYLILRKRQKYLLISFRIYFYIIIIFSVFFYFFNYRFEFAKLDNIKDEYFTSQYTITKVKNEENIYNYLKKYYNTDYNGNSKKAFIDAYVGKLNYDDFMSDISYSIEGNKILKYKYLLKLENIDKILNVSKEKQKFIKKLNNYNFFVSSDKSYYGVYNNISSLSKNFDSSKKYDLDESDREIILSRVYLLYNLENNNKKEVIDYFIDNYSLWFNVLNGDIYAGDGIFARNSISELDSDLLYIKENYNYSKEDLYSIISLLENKYNNFDSKKIYKNIILNDYKLARKLFDENIDTNNIFINKEKTISLLKNYYYSILSTTDYSQDAIVKTQFFRERRLCDTQLGINISAYVDCYALKTLRKNFIGSFIVDLYFGNNIWMIDQLDVLLDKTKSLLENISTDTEERKNINWIIKNIDSEILFEEGGEHIFNEIHDKFYDKDEKGNNLITEEGLKSLKEKMMNYRGEDKYDIDKVVIKPGYFRGDNIFEIEYEKEVYTISYGR